MPKKKQTECWKFSAEVEVTLDVEVADGSVKKFWAKNLGMVRKAFEDALTLRGRDFTRHYGDGMKLKFHMKNVSCVSVSEKRRR